MNDLAKWEIYTEIWDNSICEVGDDYWDRVQDDDRRLLPQIWRERAWGILSYINKYMFNVGVFAFIELNNNYGCAEIHHRLFFDDESSDFVDGYITAMLETTQRAVIICKVAIIKRECGSTDYKAEFCGNKKGAKPLLTILGGVRFDD